MKGESLYDERWREFRHFTSALDAMMALEALRSEGIPCYKLDDSLPGLGGARVYVQACDLDEAGRLLDTQ